MSVSLTTGMPSRSRSIPNGADLAHSQAGAEGEADEVGQVRADCRLVVIDVGEQTPALLGRQAARRCFPMAPVRLDALQVADRVGGDGLVQHGLLHDSADDGPDHPPRVGRVLGLLSRRAVRLFDNLARLLQPREVGVEVRGVALAQPQLSKLGEDLVSEAARVGVRGRVGAPLADLAHPNVGRLAEARVGLEHVGALAACASAARPGGQPGRQPWSAPAGEAARHAVEVTEAAAGDPLAVFAAYLDRTVVPSASGGRAMAAAPERVSVEFPTSLISEDESRPERQWPGLRVMVRREGIEPPTRWLGVA